MIANGFIVIFLALALLNLFSVIHNVFSKKYSSMVGPLGGGLGFIGFLLTPKLRPYAWLPFVLDFGTLDFIIASPKIAHEIWQTSRFNLVREYVAQQREGLKIVRLRLYRNNVFTIEQKVQKVIHGNYGSSIVSQNGIVGEWKRDPQGLTLTIGSQKATFQYDRDSLKQIEGFEDWEKDGRRSLKNMELVLSTEKRA